MGSTSTTSRPNGPLLSSTRSIPLCSPTAAGVATWPRSGWGGREVPVSLVLEAHYLEDNLRFFAVYARSAGAEVRRISSTRPITTSSLGY
jgi:hypothetical protein